MHVQGARFGERSGSNPEIGLQSYGRREAIGLSCPIRDRALHQRRELNFCGGISQSCERVAGSARLAEEVVAASGSVKGTLNRHVGLLEVCGVMAVGAR